MGWIRIDWPKDEPEPDWVKELNDLAAVMDPLLDTKPTLEEQDHLDSIVEVSTGRIVVRA